MRHIAIVLARGGSKRLPGKNTLDFHGKPMLAWTIEAAKNSGQFDRVLVSTDDPHIAEIAFSFGGEVPFLRATAADDFSSASAATAVALRQAEQYWGESYDVVTQLMANCPLRDGTDIVNSYRNFLNLKVDSQISCFKFGWMNPWWAAQLDAQGRPDYLFPKTRLRRSQDLPSVYCPSGAIWTTTGSSLRLTNTFYTPNHILYPLSWISALDIDDEEDFQMAKICFSFKK